MNVFETNISSRLAINILVSSSEVLTLPLVCTFEHGYCFLDQNRHNDTGDFHRPKGTSLGRLRSYDTGPPVDHTYECNQTDGEILLSCDMKLLSFVIFLPAIFYL